MSLKYSQHDLHKAIQEAFCFDNGHLYAFYLDGNQRTGKPIYYADTESVVVSTHLIAKKLREMGVQRLRGGTWNSDRVADIIKNEKYTGNALLQKKYVKDHLTKTLVWNRGILPKYYSENTHPPIVDMATFQKAQEVMNKNRERNAGKKEVGNYPFTSKIVCGICGKKYKRKTRQGRILWGCSTYLKYGKDSCPTKQIPDYILNSLSTEVIGLSVFDEIIFEKLIKEIQVPQSNLLVFIFNDGRVIQKVWQYKSSSKSCSKEERQQAQEKQLGHLERRD